MVSCALRSCSSSKRMGKKELTGVTFHRGGAELLFGNKKAHHVDLPDKERSWLLGDLLIWMKDNMLQERPELFIQDKSVRPGILILVNDADWELMNTVDYEIQPNDKIVFISTLHGG